MPDDSEEELVVAPVLVRLALTLPPDAATEPLYYPGYSDLAFRVGELIDRGRGAELAPFFSALDDALAGPLDDASSTALCEGLMESLIHVIDILVMPTVSVYRHLLPASRREWEELWRDLHGDTWPWPDV